MTRNIETTTNSDVIRYEFRTINEHGRSRNDLPHGEVEFNCDWVEHNKDSYKQLVAKLAMNWLTGQDVDHMNTLIAPWDIEAIPHGFFRIDEIKRMSKSGLHALIASAAIPLS